MGTHPLTLSALKLGDKIDAKDDGEKYYPATILLIKQAHNESSNNNEIQRLSVSPGITYLYPNDWVNDMGLFIHYKDLHFISKPNT